MRRPRVGDLFVWGHQEDPIGVLCITANRGRWIEYHAVWFMGERDSGDDCLSLDHLKTHLEQDWWRLL